MERARKSNKFKIIVGVLALAALSLLGVGSNVWSSHAADEACCKAGDTIPPH